MSELHSEIFDEKRKLRILLKEKRKAYPVDKLEYVSKVIAEQLLFHILDGNYDEVLSYMPLPGEIDTGFLHRQLFEKHIKIYLPYTEEEIVFYTFTSENNLTKGAFSIMEPDPAKEERLIFNKRKKYLIIVPGLGFDKKGGRIGFGKGFYDRFLSKIRNEGIIYETIGVCPEDFIVSKISTDERDVEMDYIFTEENSFIIKQ